MLSENEARDLTEQIRSQSKRYAELIREAWEGKVWKPLGYGSFREWLDSELGLSRARGYQLINIAIMEEELRKVVGGLPDDFSLSDLSTRSILAYGKEPFFNTYRKQAGDDPASNEKALLQLLSSIREDNTRPAVLELPSTPQHEDRMAWNTTNAFLLQTESLPTVQEVDSDRIRVVRGKLRDALANIEAMRRTYAASLEEEQIG